MAQDKHRKVGGNQITQSLKKSVKYIPLVFGIPNTHRNILNVLSILMSFKDSYIFIVNGLHGIKSNRETSYRTKSDYGTGIQ
jgi:hypothetical protein